MDLIFIIYLHDLFQISLLSWKISHQMPVLSYKLDIFTFKITHAHVLVFNLFLSFSQFSIQSLKFITLSQFKFLGHIFIEIVFFVKQCELFSHFFYINIICTPSFFHCAYHLSYFSQFRFQKAVCSNKVISFPTGLV